MAEKKPSYPQITTPRGILKFPKLTVPDTKFKPDGEYTAKIILKGEDAAKIIEQLKPLQEQAMADAKAEIEKAIESAKGEKKGKAKKALNDLKPASDPYKPVYDEDGNETGDYELTFKMAAQYKDKATGKIKRMSPHLFDAKGQPIKGTPPDIWGGTVAKVSGFAKPFYNPAADNAGVSLRLQGVQIIELVTKGSGDASRFGFGEEDGSFDASSVPADSGFGDETDPDTGGDASGSSTDDAGDPTQF